MTLGTIMLPTITAKMRSRPGKVIRASGYAASAHTASVPKVVSTATSTLFPIAIVSGACRVPESTLTYCSSVAGIGSQNGMGSRILGVVLNEVTSAQIPGCQPQKRHQHQHGTAGVA